MNVAFDPVTEWSRRVVFPAADIHDVSVGVGRRATLAPGRYRRVTLFPHAKLGLSAGEYYVDEIRMIGAGASFVLDQSRGAALLFVRKPFVFSGRVESKADSQLVLAVLEAGAMRLATPFRGTLIAPTAGAVVDLDQRLSRVFDLVGER